MHAGHQLIVFSDASETLVGRNQRCICLDFSLRLGRWRRVVGALSVADIESSGSRTAGWREQRRTRDVPDSTRIRPISPRARTGSLIGDGRQTKDRVAGRMSIMAAASGVWEGSSPGPGSPRCNKGISSASRTIPWGRRPFAVLPPPPLPRESQGGS